MSGYKKNMCNVHYILCRTVSHAKSPFWACAAASMATHTRLALPSADVTHKHSYWGLRLHRSRLLSLFSYAGNDAGR